MHSDNRRSPPALSIAPPALPHSVYQGDARRAFWEAINFPEGRPGASVQVAKGAPSANDGSLASVKN